MRWLLPLIWRADDTRSISVAAATFTYCPGGLVLRNALLAGIALAMSGPSVARPYEWLDAVTLIVGSLALYGSYLTFDELLRQFGRIAQLNGTQAGTAR